MDPIFRNLRSLILALTQDKITHLADRSVSHPRHEQRQDHRGAACTSVNEVQALCAGSKCLRLKTKCEQGTQYLEDTIPADEDRAMIQVDVTHSVGKVILDKVGD